MSGAMKKQNLNYENKLNINTLPVLPFIAHEILLSVNDQSANLNSIADIISMEPSLTARIISSANSAFFSGQRPIYSVEDAIVRLGLQRVRVMAVSILLADSFDLTKCKPFRADTYWKRAVQTSYTATKVANEINKDSTDSFYLAGLLHNIGSLLLVHAFPEEMTTVLNESINDPHVLINTLERKIIGVDHNIAGKMLLTEWQLPKDTIAVAENFSNYHYHGEHQSLINIIRFSLKWSENNYDELPDDVIIPVTNEFVIDKIKRQCIKDEAQIEAFTNLLANQQPSI